MPGEDAFLWAFALVWVGIWVWGLVTFFKTPVAGFASTLERTLIMCGLIYLGALGALTWLIAVRPIVRSRLIEHEPEELARPAAAWRQHLAP